jgi:hypothetical protein
MSLSYAQQQGLASQQASQQAANPYRQQPQQTYMNAGAPNAPSGNRYIPPTFNYGTNPMGGSARDYSTMNWNNIQQYNLPQQQNNPYLQEYMGNLRDSLGGFDQRYPNRQPVMPQFGGGDPYGMYDPRGQRGGGYGGRSGGYDPRAQMYGDYGGMSEDQMFGDSGMGGMYGRRGGGNRGGYGQGGFGDPEGYGPPQERPYRYGGGNGPRGGGRDDFYDPKGPVAPSWFDFASSGFTGGGGLTGSGGQPKDPYAKPLQQVGGG